MEDQEKTIESQSSQMEQEPGQTLAVVEPKPERKKVTWDEGLALIKKHLPAKKLGLKERAQIELALRDNPELWRAIGDMALQCESVMIEKMIDQPTAEAAIRHGMQKMRKELGQDDAPLLEQLLINQVVLCWLTLNLAQRSYAYNMSGSVTLTVGMYWEKRLTMAQARYTNAIETLAKIRKLSRGTPLQVNIGGQQINVAGGGG